MDHNYVIHKSERVYDGFLKVDKVSVSYSRFEGGMTGPHTREVLERGDSAAVLLLDRERDVIILVEQFRLPAERRGQPWIKELIAGVVREDETPEDSIRRECIEETGYKISKLEPIATMLASPGGMSERIFIYFAEASEVDRINDGGGIEEEGEDIKVSEVPRAEFLDQVLSREITDAKTIIAGYWLKVHG